MYTAEYLKCLSLSLRLLVTMESYRQFPRIMEHTWMKCKQALIEMTEWWILNVIFGIIFEEESYNFLRLSYNEEVVKSKEKLLLKRKYIGWK